MAAGGEDRSNERSGGGGGENEPEERTDLWMTTYADMVTLLMTFFVLMFAISNVDVQKASLLFAGLSRDGISSDVFERIMEYYEPSTDPDDVWFPEPSPSDRPGETPGDRPETSPGEGLAGNEELQALYDLIQEFIDENGWGDRMALVFDGEFLLLTLANDIWFSSGSADITPQMRDSARVLATLLAETYNDEKPFDILVAGHTDNVPVASGSRFRSNWQVGMSRATNFMEVLLLESGIDPGHFSATSYGEFHPLATNDTPEGRQANRRVEVKIGLRREEALWPRMLGDDLPPGEEGIQSGDIEHS